MHILNQLIHIDKIMLTNFCENVAQKMDSPTEKYYFLSPQLWQSSTKRQQNYDGFQLHDRQIVDIQIEILGLWRNQLPSYLCPSTTGKDRQRTS